MFEWVLSYLLQDILPVLHLVATPLDHCDCLCHVLLTLEEFVEETSDMLRAMLDTVRLVLGSSDALSPDQDASNVPKDDLFALSKHLRLLWVHIAALL